MEHAAERFRTDTAGSIESAQDDERFVDAEDEYDRDRAASGSPDSPKSGPAFRVARASEAPADGKAKGRIEAELSRVGSAMVQSTRAVAAAVKDAAGVVNKQPLVGAAGGDAKYRRIPASATSLGKGSSSKPTSSGVFRGGAHLPSLPPHPQTSQWNTSNGAGGGSREVSTGSGGSALPVNIFDLFDDHPSLTPCTGQGSSTGAGAGGGNGSSSATLADFGQTQTRDSSGQPVPIAGLPPSVPPSGPRGTPSSSSAREGIVGPAHTSSGRVDRQSLPPGTASGGVEGGNITLPPLAKLGAARGSSPSPLPTTTSALKPIAPPMRLTPRTTPSASGPGGAGVTGIASSAQSRPPSLSTSAPAPTTGLTTASQGSRRSTPTPTGGSGSSGSMAQPVGIDRIERTASGVSSIAEGSVGSTGPDGVHVPGQGQAQALGSGIVEGGLRSAGRTLSTSALRQAPGAERGAVRTVGWADELPSPEQASSPGVSNRRMPSGFVPHGVKLEDEEDEDEGQPDIPFTADHSGRVGGRSGGSAANLTPQRPKKGGAPPAEISQHSRTGSVIIHAVGSQASAALASAAAAASTVKGLATGTRQAHSHSSHNVPVSRPGSVAASVPSGPPAVGQATGSSGGVTESAAIAAAATDSRLLRPEKVLVYPPSPGVGALIRKYVGGFVELAGWTTHSRVQGCLHATAHRKDTRELSRLALCQRLEHSSNSYVRIVAAREAGLAARAELRAKFAADRRPSEMSPSAGTGGSDEGVPVLTPNSDSTAGTSTGGFQLGRRLAKLVPGMLGILSNGSTQDAQASVSGKRAGKLNAAAMAIAAVEVPELPPRPPLEPVWVMKWSHDGMFLAVCGGTDTGAVVRLWKVQAWPTPTAQGGFPPRNRTNTDINDKILLSPLSMTTSTSSGAPIVGIEVGGIGGGRAVTVVSSVSDSLTGDGGHMNAAASDGGRIDEEDTSSMNGSHEREREEEKGRGRVGSVGSSDTPASERTGGTGDVPDSTLRVSGTGYDNSKAFPDESTRVGFANDAPTGTSTSEESPSASRKSSSSQQTAGAGVGPPMPERRPALPQSSAQTRLSDPPVPHHRAGISSYRSPSVGIQQPASLLSTSGYVAGDATTSAQRAAALKAQPTSLTVHGYPFFDPLPVREWLGHEAHVVDMAWSPTHLLLTAGMDGFVRLWHPSRADCLHKFQHPDCVTSVAFHPASDTTFLSGCFDRKLRIWSMESGRVSVWQTTPSMVTAAAFSPDGRYAIAGLYSGHVVLFSAADGLRFHRQIECRRRRHKKARGCKVTGIDFTPTGSHMLVTTNDSRIRLVSLDTCEIVYQYSGLHNDNMQIPASFDVQGGRIVSGSEDGRVIVWRTRNDQRHPALNPRLTGEQMTRVSGYESFVADEGGQTGQVEMMMQAEQAAAAELVDLGNDKYSGQGQGRPAVTVAVFAPAGALAVARPLWAAHEWAETIGQDGKHSRIAGKEENPAAAFPVQLSQPANGSSGSVSTTLKPRPAGSGSRDGSASIEDGGSSVTRTEGGLGVRQGQGKTPDQADISRAIAIGGGVAGDGSSDVPTGTRPTRRHSGTSSSIGTHSHAMNGTASMGQHDDALTAVSGATPESSAVGPSGGSGGGLHIPSYAFDSFAEDVQSAAHNGGAQAVVGLQSGSGNGHTAGPVGAGCGTHGQGGEYSLPFDLFANATRSEGIGEAGASSRTAGSSVLPAKSTDGLGIDRLAGRSKLAAALACHVIIVAADSRGVLRVYENLGPAEVV